MTHIRHLSVVLVTATAVGLSACASDPNRDTKRGAAIGAVLGAVAGHQVDGDKGRYIGAVVGALAGGAAGNYMDKQRKELEQKLAAEAARDELQIVQLSGDALKIGVASDISFETNSATLQSGALNTFAKIANVLKDYDKTVIHVVGHTDSTGSAQYNQSLSERRAAAVSTFLASQGVPPSRVREEGRGERELLIRTGDNVNEARNRRVDIIIKPVIEGQENQAWTPPPYLGG
ncbi:OmpA family protein [Flagellatimonas centrodinii]|uniref:OmpA family protein n=1 Tax=Flagellatimonas centrodinii TaxID=2806210 RepID=UPI001FEDF914|nr:OmpA family protein [Flagellatimonas centrodinii]ULQ45757.1 OmpA family protein [Flagellatimonas centrodinii]